MGKDRAEVKASNKWATFTPPKAIETPSQGMRNGAKLIQVIFGIAASKPKEDVYQYYPAWRRTNPQYVVLGRNHKDFGIAPGRLTGFIKAIPNNADPCKEAKKYAMYLGSELFTPAIRDGNDPSGDDYVLGLEYRGKLNFTEHDGMQYEEHEFFCELKELTIPPELKHIGQKSQSLGAPTQYEFSRKGVRPWNFNEPAPLPDDLSLFTGMENIEHAKVGTMPWFEMPADDRIWYPSFLEGNAFVSGNFKFMHEVLVSSNLDVKFQKSFKNLLKDPKV
jgi:hypothetical protein